MKIFFRRIVKGIWSQYAKLRLAQKQESRGAKFNPAPSYWALVPVRPEELMLSKKIQNKNHQTGSK